MAIMFTRPKKVWGIDSFHRKEGVVFPEKRASTQQRLGENCGKRWSVGNELSASETQSRLWGQGTRSLEQEFMPGVSLLVPSRGRYLNVAVNIVYLLIMGS